jgi:hypothetical protein
VILEAYADITPPHIDAKLLNVFRDKRHCEYCKCFAWKRLEPHHLQRRKMNGWARLDIPINLISLCSGVYGCHAKVTAGEIDDSEILALVATREGVLQSDIEQTIASILRRGKVFQREDAT